MDARHHPFDVLSGSTIGIVIGWIAYRQYFPSLSDFHAKGRAYNIVSYNANVLAGYSANPDQRTWGRDREAVRNEELTGYEPTRVDAEQPAAFVPTEPAGDAAGSTGNHFRDEISTSQRQRRHRSHRGGGGPGGSRFHGRDETPWQEIAEDEDGYELQQQYTLSNPNPPGTGYFDPYNADLANQGTAYHSQTATAARSPPASPPSGPTARPLDTLGHSTEPSQSHPVPV
jgi:diacylglycerol diphosphate phosphatase/phosphatidate phosphatase